MFASRTNWRLDQNRLARALEEHRRAGRELFDLTASNPTTCRLAYPEREVLEALSDERALEYRPDSKGLVEARESVAAYYLGRTGFSGSNQFIQSGQFIESGSRVDPANVVLTSGTSEGYSHVFRLLCEVGDEVLVPAPSYPLFEFLADLGDIRLVPYPLLYDHGWQIDLSSLRAALTTRSRAVMVVHPNNPTGSFVKSGEAAALGAICREREMAIVADEVFLDYASGGIAPATFALHEQCLTFTLSGLSKVSLLPQMKLAWIVVSGPRDLRGTATERLEIIADTYLSPSTPIQLAAPKFLDLRHRMQVPLQERIAANAAVLDAVLQEGHVVTCLEREGGWYAVLRVPVTGTDEDLAITLLNRGNVYVHPGHFFNFPRDGYLVLSLITPQVEFQEGMYRLLKMVAE